jgi:hypothetical protein
MRRLHVGAAATVVLTLVLAPSASAQSCTGQLVRTVAPLAVPFGVTVVAPTAQVVDNFGQQVIAPEATSPHDACLSAD